MNYEVTTQTNSNQDEPPYYDPQTGEYLGAFKSEREAKEYFLSTGMSEEDYDWLEANKDNLFSEEETKEFKYKPRKIVSVIGGVNGISKLKVKFWLNPTNRSIISHLQRCDRNTPRDTVAALLEALFSDWPAVEGYWLWIAQTYTCRVINLNINEVVKEHRKWNIKKTPAEAFSFFLRFRRKRKLRKPPDSTSKRKEDRNAT